MNWAIYDGDVAIMRALRSILGWRTTAWWRNRSAWEMATDPNNVQRWKHKLGFHNRGVQWDTPMSRWAGEEKDWVQLMAQGLARKEDVPFIKFTRVDETSDRKKNRERRRRADKETKRVGSTLSLRCPRRIIN